MNHHLRIKPHRSRAHVGKDAATVLIPRAEAPIGDVRGLKLRRGARFNARPRR